MSKSDNLRKAKSVKNDEFYTLFGDVVAEMAYYRYHFQNKSLLCNCDDPVWSAFWRYFHLNFGGLGLRKLVATHYSLSGEPTYKMEYCGGDDAHIEVGVKTPLQGNGDFRSEECLVLMNDADVVVTNPPFSLAREFLTLLMEKKKSFLIVGDLNWITYKEVFPFVQNNQLWLGHSGIKQFLQPDGVLRTFGNKLWFTNLDHEQRHVWLPLTEHYAQEKYPFYVNFDGINVDRVSDIPCDYDGVMGVPVSFMSKYNPEQFELVGFDQTCRKPIQDCGLPKGFYRPGGSRLYVKERDDWYRMCYSRLLIRRKQ